MSVFVLAKMATVIDAFSFQAVSIPKREEWTRAQKTFLTFFAAEFPCDSCTFVLTDFLGLREFEFGRVLWEIGGVNGGFLLFIKM
jgi:hypothetical protein